MIDKLQTRECVERDKNLFEKVAKGFVSAKDVYKTQYTMLDYIKILDNMIEFINGYKEYESGDDHKFDGKVLTVTRHFYDKMFTDKSFRKVINLDEFKNINEEYLKKTKELQNLLESYLKADKISAELNSLLSMTNNQYKKLAKVYRDDMKIYLWITTADSSFFAYHIDDYTKKAFNDKKSPVIHKYKKGDTL